MSAEYSSAVVHDGETSIEIGIVAEHVFHKVVVELVVDKQGIVWLEEDICSILVVGLFCHVTLQLSALKNRSSYLSISI